MAGVRRTIVVAPHDDGGGGFAVLWRIVRALVHVADDHHTALDVYCFNSSVADGGQERLNELGRGMQQAHRAVFVPTDNLIRLPKDPRTAAVDGARIPDLLRDSVRPRWHEWPCEPNGIRAGRPLARRADRTAGGTAHRLFPNAATRLQSAEDVGPQSGHAANVRPASNAILQSPEGTSPSRFSPALWARVDLGISNGVPQLHRVARKHGFPSIEAGDWFFSVGLRGCMEESGVPPDVVASTERDLRMIEADEFAAREVWLVPYVAALTEYAHHVADGGLQMHVMNGLLWSGDPQPREGIVEWQAARQLRREIDRHVAASRGLTEDRARRVRVVYVVGGATGVWSGIIHKLSAEERRESVPAVIDLDRQGTAIAVLERGGGAFVSNALEPLSGEERHLATCRASDCGVTRTAGGVLGFAATRRAVLLADEPGHWLGRIQREQCVEAGICVTLSIGELLADPHAAIHRHADMLGTTSALDETVRASERLRVGAEREFSEYLWRTYLA
jgi:hypothetical protein